MHTTRLTADDAPRYRELMLEAYVEAAEAFTSTAEERLAQPMTWWIDRIAAPSGRSLSFGAVESGQIIGTVALEFSGKPIVISRSGITSARRSRNYVQFSE